MQYKIPVQIENEDTIVFGLSIRQIMIIMLGGALAYSTFQSLQTAIASDIAIIISLTILIIFVGVAYFRVSEMTFLPAILNFIRLNINSPIRIWDKGVGSYSILDTGYSVGKSKNTEVGVSKNTEEAFQTLEDKLTKL